MNNLFVLYCDIVLRGVKDKIAIGASYTLENTADMLFEVKKEWLQKYDKATTTYKYIVGKNSVMFKKDKDNYVKWYITQE
jgi:hypothetical protein